MERGEHRERLERLDRLEPLGRLELLAGFDAVMLIAGAGTYGFLLEE